MNASKSWDARNPDEEGGNTPAVPGAGKITLSCDYRYWEGRVDWDYRKVDYDTCRARR